MKTFKTVLKKEFKSLFRGGLGLITSLILPLILMPLLMTIILSSNKKEDEQVNTPKLALYVQTADELINVDQNNSLYHEEIDYVLGTVLRTLNPSIVLVTDLNKALTFEKIDIALIFDADLLSKMEVGYFNINVVYNISDSSGIKFSSHILNLIANFSAALTELRLNSLGFNGSEFVGVNYNTTTIQEFSQNKIEGLNNQILITLVPTIIISFISFGSMTASSELFSLEKERNTLESLLSTGGKRREIVLAKVFVNLVFSLVGALFQLISVLLAYLINIKSFSDTVIYFRFETLLFLFIGLISLAILAAILNVFVYVFTKNNRGATAYSAILMLLPIIISYVVMTISPAGIHMAEIFIPFLGTVLAMRMAVAGAVNISYLIISSVINILLSGLLTYLIVKRYCSEKIFKVD
ncbi:MAG: ABC transporter permease subunit [Acholeplasmatales bacterium]|jgi:ABC-type Na+ efflux pump permease subunit|nr:ABC transporter permease subunit [Acholeplasmatales bacterium]